MALEVLACHACGGHVPLGDGDVIPCPFCGAAVEVPLAHRELREAERRDAAARTEAAALFAKYGGKPSLALRVFAVLFHPWFLVLDGFFILLLAVMLGILVVGMLLGPLVHANLWDTLPDAPKGYGMLLVASASLLGGIVLGVHGRRRLLATRSLQAALAARPPTRAGERALCRECGAPLYVPPGAEGVRCAYCRADNLVDIPRAWIEGVAASGARVGHAIEDAAAWLREEQRRQRRSLRRQLGLAGAALLAFVTLVAAVSQSRALEWTAGWSEYVHEPRTLVRLPGGVHFRNGRREVPLARDCRPTQLVIPADECQAGSCQVWLYAALRKGEQLSLRSADLPGATRVRAVLHSHFWWGADLREGFGETLKEAPLAEAAFTAPWSAWYQIRVDLPAGVATHSLCAVLGP